MPPVQPQPQKFSRYRSVRNANAAAKPTPAPALEPVPQPSSQASTALSKSRYRRRPTNQSNTSVQDAIAESSPSSRDAQSTHPTRRPTTSATANSTPHATPSHMNQAQQEAYDILNGEADRVKRLREKQKEADREHKRVVEQERALERMRLEEQKEKEEGEKRAREQEIQDALAEKQRIETEKQEQKAREREERKAREREAKESKARKQAEENDRREADRKLVSRGRSVRNNAKTYPRKMSVNEPSVPELKQRSSSEGPRDWLGGAGTIKKPSGANTSSAAAAAAAATAASFDAPVSAVNAGTRRVTVSCNESTITLPIEPESTAVDILQSAATVMSETIDLKAYDVYESFDQVGLERPLRRYEHIRDVMNSWDHDDQNKLLILSRVSEDFNDDLEAAHAPSARPGETSLLIWYSQKPGNWDKRWVTLKSDGQVTIAKNSGGETKNICHLSDFDGYMLTSKQMKKLDPPKKHCFAIKSQQKSAMFLNTSNFVHFFASKDQEMAKTWYRAVQRWRSWYLVHEMGYGRKVSAPGVKPSHTKNESLASSFYQLGSYKPLFSDDLFSSFTTDPIKAPGSHEKTTLDATILDRKQSVNNRGGPPVSYPRKLSKDEASAPTTRHRGPSIVQKPSPDSIEEPFATTGLLGRTYTQRKKAMEHKSSSASHENPYDLPSRTRSTRQVKPLVDLTPQYQELPHHLHKGHGVIPEHVPSGGLVDLATSAPGFDTSIPPSTDRRRDLPHQHHHHTSSDLKRSGTTRTKRSVTDNRPGSSDSTNPFTGYGILSRYAEGQGGRDTGRGVASGNRNAQEPLIDLQLQSQFQPGTLLDKLQKYQGEDEHGLVVDREKRVEITTKTGEAARDF